MTRVIPVCVLAGVVAWVPTNTPAQVPLPPDVKATCVVTPQLFSSWFASGKVTPNGAVKFANSVGFTLDQTNPHCSFYQWSEQMFLWLTSPAGGGHVFDSSIFFNVDADTGAITPNAANAPLKLGVRDRKHVKSLVRDKSGAIIDDGTGQAGGGGSLMAQSGALVYYSVHVNDVYAYFKTGSLANAFKPSGTTMFPKTFPTAQEDLNQIVAFAQTQGVTLPDAPALTMELKMSWVDASTVDATKYVTTMATIPTYDFTQKPVPIPGTKNVGWKQTGTKTTKMAMVGMHVVGPVQGHPEMVWATFEHADNAPNNTYQYTATDGTTKTVPFNPAPPMGTKWQFSAANAPNDPTKFNLENLTTSSKPPGWIIQSIPGNQNASNTLRQFPWGVPSGAAGVTDATEILSINNSVLGQLAAGDTRKNYVLVGAVWTGGGVPTGATPPPPPPANTNPIGSVALSNATMETYQQTFKNQPSNCFGCHNGDPLNGLSHIWGVLNGLPLSKK